MVLRQAAGYAGAALVPFSYGPVPPSNGTPRPLSNSLQAGVGMLTIGYQVQTSTDQTLYSCIIEDTG